PGGIPRRDFQSPEPQQLRNARRQHLERHRRHDYDGRRWARHAVRAAPGLVAFRVGSDQGLTLPSFFLGESRRGSDPGLTLGRRSQHSEFRYHPAALTPLLLSASSISKSFEGVSALRGVSFDLREGEVHALVGENGAGKSTLIKIVSGAEQPDEGSVTVA